MIEATAPGKVILFGEHAVVYGRPALAAPVTQLRARAVVETGDGPDVRLVAPDLGRATTLAAARETNPLAATVRLVARRAGRPLPPGVSLSVSSAIPIASGLGSGAAIAVAVIRALDAYFALGLSREEVSALAYETERLHHGTPSGIDNTVIAYAQPVWFVKGQAPQPFVIPHTFWLVIASTGIASPTRATVGDVRRGWQADPASYERLFDEVAELVKAGRTAMLAGDWPRLGALMTANHALLGQMGVSAPLLDRLTATANAAGAFGAKLSGGGRGGNVIALVEPAVAETVAAALCDAGAAARWITPVANPPPPIIL